MKDHEEQKRRVEAVKARLESLNPAMKKRVVLQILRLYMPGMRFPKVESYMEKLFKRDMSMKPAHAAAMVMKYLRIDPRMRPFLTAMAQKVKLRVYVRKKRAEERQKAS